VSRRAAAARRTAAGAATALALAAAASGCGGSGPEEPAPVTTAGAPDCGGQTVQVASRPGSFIFYPFFVAIEAGYMAEAGLTVEEVDLSAAADAVGALVSGSVQFTVASVSTIISAINEGAPITLVGSLMDQQGLQIIVKRSVLEEKGITESSSVEEKLTAFAGGERTYVASSPGSGSDTVARIILDEAGVDSGDESNFLYAGSSQAVTAAFEAGNADATGLPVPQAYTAIERGDGALLFNLAAGDFPPLDGVLYTGIATSQRTAEQNPGLVDCFLYAIARAEALIASDYQGAADTVQEYMVEYVPDQDVELYQRAVADYEGAFPDSPVVTDRGITGLLDVLNRYGQGVDVSAEEIVTNEFAERATQRAAEVAPSR
jgi:NitT/TauT family transport system substrate-binding protein